MERGLEHDTPAPQRIAQYQVLRELGHGGMGTVYLARRDDDDQLVAIKVAREIRSARALDLFRQERRILAALEHPNVARLLDGGTTSDGVPYFVMEYVEGLPIDEYCNTRHLDIKQRLELFTAVCTAVDHAHRNLVVHRDLKPTNILVTNGVPKLLDFGIANWLEADDAARALDPATRRGLTPEFASPEQIRGEPITTSADVFGLGVLLYRLLANRSPYGIGVLPPYELARAICELTPPKPSSTAGSPQTSRALRGDLDTIVLKALKKEPSERYESAAQLGDDITRHLDGRPIVAREDAVFYRAGRFARRHRAAVAATTAMAIALVGGFAITLWQANEAEAQRLRAERHVDDVRKLASAMIFEINDGIENLPGAIPARQLLINRAIEYFDSLAADARDNAALQRELAAAYDKLGEVLGRPYSSNLGESQGALASYRKALAIREALAQGGDRQARLELWTSYVSVGNSLRETGNTGGGLAVHEQARALAESLLAQSPNDPAMIRAAARTAVTLAHSYEQAGRVADSLVSARRALALDEQLLARDPANHAQRSAVATDHGRIGIALMRLRQWPESLDAIRTRYALAQAVAAADTSNVAFRRALSTAHVQMGQALTRNGDLPGAQRELTAALGIREALAAQDADDRQATIDVMFAALELSRVLDRVGDERAAVQKLEQAVAIGEELMRVDPNYVFFRLSAAQGLTRLAQARVKAGDTTTAAALATRARSLAEALTRLDAADVRARFELALAFEATGDVLGDPHWYRRSVALMTEMRDAGVLPGATLFGEELERLTAVARKLTDRARASS